jgi:tetratricopeptide (TPR) repeat protein
MAKRKKEKATKRLRPRLGQALMNELNKATQLVEDGEYVEAQAQLLQLVKRYPHNNKVLLFLVDVSAELDDWPTFARYNEELLAGQKRGRDQADTLNNLVFAYTKLFYLALAWQTAQYLLQHYPDYPTHERMKSFASSTEKFILEQADVFWGNMDLSPAERLDVMIAHDQVRYYTESGQSAKAIAAAETILDKVPDIISVRNNLSLALHMQGQTEQAINHAQQVLAQDPVNVHALANLVRFHFLLAQFERARHYLDRLQNLSTDRSDLLVKQAESLAFFGEDKAIRAVYRQAKERPDSLTPSLLHLAAVAYYRQGKTKVAWRLWNEAIQQQPTFSLARNSLRDRYLPVGERDAPWYWPLSYWITEDFQSQLVAVVQPIVQVKRGSEAQLTQAVIDLLEQHPYLPPLLPHILERGDGAARNYVVNLCRLAETPALLQILYDFARSQYGTDALRMEVMQFLSQHHPHFLPDNKEVGMWVEGEVRPLLFMGFEIHGEPDIPENLPPIIMGMLTEVYELLQQGKAAQAESLLKEVIAAAPDFPSAYNQLGVAYQMQGKEEESRRLLEDTLTRFPDYLFARVAMARSHAQAGRIAEARNLLNPLMQRERLHFSELRALAQAQIVVALADGQKDTARSWLTMWSNVEPDAPDLAVWRQRIGLTMPPPGKKR